MSRKSRRDAANEKNWEHSRYKDWRPSFRDEQQSGGGRYYEERPRRRKSILVWLFRVCISIAVIVMLFGPGVDYVNGRSKAAEGQCAVRVVVDGDSILPGCPDGRVLPKEIAGYDAPELLSPGCIAEFQAALLAGLEIRKALFGADLVELRVPGAPDPVPDAEPEPDPDPATEPVAATGEGEEAPDPLALPEADPPALPEAEPPVIAEPEPEVPVVKAQWVRVLVDGGDLAEVMLASGTVQPSGGPGWCE